jgi:hypothetical protein
MTPAPAVAPGSLLFDEQPHEPPLLHPPPEDLAAGWVPHEPPE